MGIITYILCTMFFNYSHWHTTVSGRIIISVMPTIETESLLTGDINKFVSELSIKINSEYDSISKITKLSDYQTPCL